MKTKFFFSLILMNLLTLNASHYVEQGLTQEQFFDSHEAYTRLTWRCQCGVVYAHGEVCDNPDCPTNK